MHFSFTTECWSSSKWKYIWREAKYFVVHFTRQQARAIYDVTYSVWVVGVLKVISRVLVNWKRGLMWSCGIMSAVWFQLKNILAIELRWFLFSDPNGSYKAITGEWYSDVSHSNGTMTRTCSVNVMVTKSTMESVFVCAVSLSETGFQKQVYLSLDVNSK